MFAIFNTDSTADGTGRQFHDPHGCPLVGKVYGDDCQCWDVDQHDGRGTAVEVCSVCNPIDFCHECRQVREGGWCDCSDVEDEDDDYEEEDYPF